MKKVFKQISVLFMLAMLFAPVVAVKALAPEDLYGGSTVQGNVESSLGMEGNKDPRVIVADVIRILLGFLGIIAVIIIIMAGFKWMTAGGDKGKIDEAKKLMTNGVIGLIIILSAWALSTFVINTLIENVSN